MMDNPEEVLHFLEEFTKRKPRFIPPQLNEYLAYVARTGDPVYQWPLVKTLFKEKLNNVITDFNETAPGLDIPQCPNVDPFDYDALKNSLLERLESFTQAPFTVQRICELLIYPRKQYNRIDKFMRAIEKNILVVSTREPGFRRYYDDENGGDPLINGADNNTDYSLDVDMVDMSWKRNIRRRSSMEPQPGSSDSQITVDVVDQLPLREKPSNVQVIAKVPKEDNAQPSSTMKENKIVGAEPTPENFEDQASPEAQPSSPEAQPSSPEEQPYSPEGQPYSPEGEPYSPEGQPYSPEVEPSSPEMQPSSPKDVETISVLVKVKTLTEHKTNTAMEIDMNEDPDHNHDQKQSDDPSSLPVEETDENEDQVTENCERQDHSPSDSDDSHKLKIDETFVSEDDQSRSPQNDSPNDSDGSNKLKIDDNPVSEDDQSVSPVSTDENSCSSTKSDPVDSDDSASESKPDTDNDNSSSDKSSESPEESNDAVKGENPEFEDMDSNDTEDLNAKKVDLKEDEGTKGEDINNDEDMKEEDTKEEDTKEEDTKEEDTKKEDITKEDTKKEETKEGETKEEDTKDIETKEEDTKEDDSNEEVLVKHKEGVEDIISVTRSDEDYSIKDVNSELVPCVQPKNEESTKNTAEDQVPSPKESPHVEMNEPVKDKEPSAVVTSGSAELNE